MTTSKKITLATFKSFINKNKSNLFIKIRSEFNGMTDGCEYNKNPQFIKVDENAIDMTDSNSFGITGVWVVGGSRNLFSSYEDNQMSGIEVYNCCGSFVLAVKK